MNPIPYYIAMVLSNFSGVELDVKQTTCIATAIYHEARGEPVIGQSAVSYVINNRVHSKRYPNTACEVVYQPHQFTDIRFARPDKKSKAWKIAAEIAVYTQVGLIDDQTEGATIYYNPDKASPSWDWSKLELVGYIENHKFMREL